jgi:sugar phosphate isomerase/epimerase
MLKKHKSRIDTWIKTIFSVTILLTLSNCSGSGKKPDSNLKGVQVGVISYSWRSMPSSAGDILSYCIRSGISSIELMGNVAEEFAGIPPLPPLRPRNAELTEEEKALHELALKEAQEKRREWRLNVPMDKFRELRKMYNDSGVSIHIVKFAPANWTDGEIDYAFTAARTMGANGITNEIGHKACKRLGKFAEKHDMYAIYHNHGQPGDPGFSFEEFLEYSPNNMLNLDVGHFFGATGTHPNEIIERLHDRIFSIHLKDKTGKSAAEPNQNRPWGEGDTPLGDILKLIQKNNWPIYCDIELEYPVPDDSDAVKETIRCLEYCRNILL